MIDDRCHGTTGNPRKIYWSDDSYSQGSFMCSGCQDCNLPQEVPQRPQEPYSGPWDALPKGDAT